MKLEKICTSIIAFASLSFGASVILNLPMNIPPATKQLEEKTEFFLEELKLEDVTNFQDTFSKNFASSFTTEQMLNFLDREDINPLKNWAIVDSYANLKKGTGRVDVKTVNSLIRFNYSYFFLEGWRIQNFYLCRVNQSSCSSFISYLEDNPNYSANIPSANKQLEETTEIFLQQLKLANTTNLRDTFSENLASRFTIEQMLNFVDREGIIPLTNWTIIDSSSNTKKGTGIVHVKTANSLLRFDYFYSNGWKLQNFCRVNQFIEKTALTFVDRLRLGNLEQAQQMTVDAVFPRRRGKQFPAYKLQSLHQMLKTSPVSSLKSLNLHEHYSYRQSMEIGNRDMTISLHHLKYDRDGCNFFVFDIENN